MRLWGGRERQMQRDTNESEERSFVSEERVAPHWVWYGPHYSARRSPAVLQRHAHATRQPSQASSQGFAAGCKSRGCVAAGGEQPMWRVHGDSLAHAGA
jgi:hypothetical protein